MRRYTTLAMESRGDIRCITLDRPERRNAFDSRMISELTQAFDESAQEPSLRGILLSSAGPVFAPGPIYNGCNPRLRSRMPRQQMTPTALPACIAPSTNLPVRSSPGCKGLPSEAGSD